jgi:hypothetical protein
MKLFQPFYGKLSAFLLAYRVEGVRKASVGMYYIKFSMISVIQFKGCPHMAK